MVKEHDDDPLGRPGFVPKGIRRPSQDQIIVEKSGAREAFEIEQSKDNLKIRIDAQRYEPEEITVCEDNDEQLVVSGKRRDSRTHEVLNGQEFRKTFPMPRNANLRDMKKQYGANGVLLIDIPIKY